MNGIPHSPVEFGSLMRANCSALPGWWKTNVIRPTMRDSRAGAETGEFEFRVWTRGRSGGPNAILS